MTIALMEGAAPDRALAPQPAHVTGPTWLKWATGEWYLPELSIGLDVASWLALNVNAPDGSGKPFKPTPEQLRFLLWWYALDQTGRFIYRAGVLRRMKGWGKDPLVAALTLAELCGPTQFAGFDAEGRPMAKPHRQPWVQVAATSREQTRTTFGLYQSMVTEKLRDEHELELYHSLVRSKIGLIEGVTANPYALEGRRPTMVVANETQYWFANNMGHEMFNVISGNVAKAPYGKSRWLMLCNAHRPGEESIAERQYTNAQLVAAGKAIDTGILYDAIEAPPDTPISEIPPRSADVAAHKAGIARLRAGLEIGRGDAHWLDLDAVVAEILDVNNSVQESRRKWLNQINAVEDSWLSPAEWDRCKRPVQLRPGDRITLAFDGSRGGDWSALAACRVEDGAVFLLASWNPKSYGGTVPTADVDAHVRGAFERYDIVGFRADLYAFESYVDKWTVDFGRKLKVNATRGKKIAFDMRGGQSSAVRKVFAADCERFETAARAEQVIHDGNPILRAHVTNARRQYTRDDRTTIRKSHKDSDRKIDAAVVAVLAYGLRQEYLMARGHRSGGVTVVY